MELQRRWRDENRRFTVEQALDCACAADHEGGIAESASRHATALGEKLATVVAMLHENGKLSDDQVIRLLAYDFEKVDA